MAVAMSARMSHTVDHAGSNKVLLLMTLICIRSAETSCRVTLALPFVEEGNLAIGHGNLRTTKTDLEPPEGLCFQ